MTTENGINFTEIDRVFALQQANKLRIRATGVSERIEKLNRILDWTSAEASGIQRALAADFSKPAEEVLLSEIYGVRSEIKHTIRNLRRWLRPRATRSPIIYPGSKSWIQYESRGVVLIISPWNFPFLLTIKPLVSAIAAGNCVIIKPSEFSSHTTAFLQKFISSIFKENEVALFTGDHQVASYLTARPFDHIFFTGSPAVGKIVMAAAAHNLTSVTLELGGKSPTIIDEKFDLKIAAQKITWGRFSNCGQQCVAPEYVLIPESRADEFVEWAKFFIRKLYGPTDEAIASSRDYARIISSRHFARIKNLYHDAVDNGAKVAIGGYFIEAENFLAPTILLEVPDHAKIMHEEVFGPILQIVTYRSLAEALAFINARAKPLALYIFSHNQSFIHQVLSQTSAGGSCINDVLVHFTNVHLPFGGVNHSGIGNSHGFYGFKAFSHERAIFKQPAQSPTRWFYPPYTPRVRKLIDLVIKFF